MGWSPHHIMSMKKNTHWNTKQIVKFEKVHKDASLGLCQRSHSQLKLPLLNWLTQTAAQSSNNRCEVAADIQTEEQYSSTGSMNAQKHLETAEAYLKTLIVFLKLPTLPGA